MTDSLPPEVERALAGDSAPASAEPAPRPLPAQPGRYQWGDQPIAWARVTADTLVSRGPTLFYGLVQTGVTLSQARADLYDGDNASGRRVLRVMSFQDNAGTVDPTTVTLILPKPILLERGLFFDVTTVFGELTVFFLPVREEQLVPRREGPVEAE